ncbi:MAG: LarC family nickel insertion protein [Chloroflexi bacterium]|nr:LarC family nickel insertion protein [Chloroflexota bacterium]
MSAGDDAAAVFDCFSGIAGDMTLAALIDAGAPQADVEASLRRLGVPAFSLGTERVRRGGIEGLHLLLNIDEERTYQPGEMRELVTAAGLHARVTGRSLRAIELLAAGEAAAHGTSDPHFHEVGGVDALIDIVGSMLALELLGVEEAWCPVVTVGAGTVTKSAHGVIPAAPGPAAAHILQDAGFALRFVEAGHELVTPTGAAILAAVARPGPGTIVAKRHGIGAGTLDASGRPNALRVFVGRSVAVGAGETSGPRTRQIVELAANIDDMPAAFLAHARDRLLQEGALDAWLEPIGMKKGRAATKLCALADPEDEARLAALMVRETSTLGVRVTGYRRYEAARRVETFASSLGEVRVKLREWEGATRAAPEFEDIKALAARRGMPALEVQAVVEADLRAMGWGGAGDDPA